MANKKRLLLLLAFTLVLISCAHIETPNSLAKADLKGKVRSVTELTIENRRNDTTKIMDDFDINGNRIKSNFYSGIHHFEWKYVYDNNNLVSDSSFGSEKIEYTTTYKNDSRNNKTEMRQLLPDGYPKMITTYSNSYYFNGRLKEWKEYNAIGKLSRRKTFEYNNAGKPTETIVYIEADKSAYKTEMKYDEKGNLSGSTEYWQSVIVEKTTFKYSEFDKTGNWLKKEEFKNGHPYRIHYRQIRYY
jgi:hypothetical protein